MKKLVSLVGKKIGVTRIYQDDGSSVPVSAVEVMTSSIIDKKTVIKSGYDAVVASCGKKKRSKLNKAEIGVIKKFKLKSFSKLYEIRKPKHAQDDIDLPEVGSDIGVADFSLDVGLDVSGYSKGKGFAGTIKRWNFSGQDRSHGNSLSHRVPGSIGMLEVGRVLPGKKMAGHMGDRKITLRNRKIIQIDVDSSVVYIKGGLPGAIGGEIWLKQII